MKLKEKIKEKSIKLSARIFGIMTACLSSAIAAKALLGLCLVGVVICLGASGKNGISSVKGWLIAIGVAAALLVFGDAFLDSIYVA